MDLKIIGLLIIGVLVLLFASRPTRYDFDRELLYILHEAIGSSHLRDDLIPSAAVRGCQFRIEDCATIVKSASTVSNTDYVCFTCHQVVSSTGFIDCWGVLKNFMCDVEVTSGK
jgi:hypothetical protein